jgi:zinc protease
MATDAGRAPRDPRSNAERGIPAVGRPRPVKLPTVADHTLPNGLRVIVARRPGVPRFEARLRIPTSRGSRTTNLARETLLAETLLSGTGARTSVEIAESLQGMGASLGASADNEVVVVSGSALAPRRREFLSLFGEIVQGPAFPADEVAIERDRVVQDILMARSQPTVIAREAVARRLFGDHPYGDGVPDPADVERVLPAALRRAHKSTLLPPGSVLVLVGDLPPAKAIADVEAAFGTWPGKGRYRSLPAPGPLSPGPTLIVDRPGAVQTNIRLAGRAIPRTHPDYPALALANTVFGGYFTSRLVDNIRERRGYTYSPRSSVDHRQAVSTFAVSADVGTEVTAAALLEIRYELGRMVATKIEQVELDAARRYLQGTLAMSIQTQSGLTGYLSVLTASGLGVDYLREFPARLEHVTVDHVADAARRYLAPRGLITVLVGDAAAIRPTVEAFDEVELDESKADLDQDLDDFAED